MRKKILVADDDINIISSINYLLDSEKYEVLGATSVELALRKVAQEDIDLILMDMNFRRDTTSGGEGVELVTAITELQANQAYLTPIIAMTGWATVNIAVDALKAGAKDFIQKPWNDEQLIRAIDTQLMLAATARNASLLKEQNKLLQAQFNDCNGLVAESEQMKSLIATLDDVAKSDMSILLTGENGTGKSLLANYIHKASDRRENPFVSVNMGAIPEALFESEMFGHLKGAFTDAKENRSGRFELAEGGSLFLDEVGNMSLHQQAKLLRVIEDHCYEPVGSSKTRVANVRLICATNCNLEFEIVSARFRQDLYYRLNTIELHIPPLRQRAEDIAGLAQHFLQKHCRKYNRRCPTLTEEAIVAMQSYKWPGNVRELDHLMEKLIFTCKKDQIQSSDLNLQTTAAEEHQWPEDRPADPEMTLEEIEQRAIQSRLKQYAGNVAKTVESLGLTRSSYYRRINKFDR
jgi:DNA-binding NtrC family response regulator